MIVKIIAQVFDGQWVGCEFRAPIHGVLIMTMINENVNDNDKIGYHHHHLHGH